MSAELTTTFSHDLRNLSFLWLEITAKCNLECVHCYADSGPRHDVFGSMKTTDWLDVLLEAANVQCRQVQFIGGEPTLHPDLTRMISFAFDHGYNLIEVFTNLTHLTEELVDTFLRCRVRIATSFYSDNSATHDLITKRPGSFDRSVAGIKRILEAGLPLRVGIIEMPENAGHSKRAQQFLSNLGVSRIGLDFQRGVGRGASSLHQLEPMAELCGECWKGKLCVTAEGRVYPCVFSRFADIGSAKAGIQRILSQDSLQDFRHSLRKYQDRKHLKENLTVKRVEAPVRYPDITRDCNPDLLAPCSPDLAVCGPNLKCVPDTCSPPTFDEPDEPFDIPKSPWAPDERSVQEGNYVASAGWELNCSPDTCSPCGPQFFCVPKHTCSPDNWCPPVSAPCQPETTCNPETGPRELTIVNEPDPQSSPSV
jgi:MoaA/NifB/PqqE/SkfB family radical SAM enzyme